MLNSIICKLFNDFCDGIAHMTIKINLILNKPENLGPLLVTIINLILTAIINLIFNIINNNFLIKKIYREDGNKKRIELYDEIIVSFNRIRDDYFIVSDEKCISKLILYKYKMKLFASDKIYNKFLSVYDYVKLYYDGYKEYYYKCRPDENIELAEFEMDDKTGELNVYSHSMNEE